MLLFLKNERKDIKRSHEGHVKICKIYLLKFGQREGDISKLYSGILLSSNEAQS